MDQGYKILFCDDIDIVADFYENSWSPAPFKKNREWLNWMMYSNPHVKIGTPPIIIAMSNDVLVGHLMAYPSLMWIAGKSFEFAWIHNLYVSPEHRRNKIGTSLMDFAADVFGTVIGSGQSSTTDIIQNKYAWSTISQQIQYETILPSKSLVSDGSKPSLYRISRRLIAMIWGECIRGLKKRNIAIHRRDSFSSGVESLWDTIKNSDIIVSDRSRDALMWRFSKHPYYKYDIYEAEDNSGNIAAYVVVRYFENTCIIVDYLSVKDIKFLISLILKICHDAKNKNCLRVVFNGLSILMANALSSCGFIKTSSGQFFRMHPSSVLSFSNSLIQFTAFDSDIDR
ncbi:MAG: GNAT family N-acetyltransferase [Desulfomicrobium apsheronum]|nr:GNAT family N-acetyltransferase [Desulfomicrobium apsheronum]